jgi:hypothetical protein
MQAARGAVPGVFSQHRGMLHGGDIKFLKSLA